MEGSRRGGHPVGATGLAQIAELTWQLRGEAGDRQVEGARIGLAHNSGGWLEGDSAACKRPRSGTRELRWIALPTPTLRETGTGSRDGSLVAGKCAACGASAWPRRSVCYRCGSDEVLEHALSTEGLLVTWTTAWVAVEGIEPPYVLGMVRLGGVEIFMHLRGKTEGLIVPRPIRIVVDPEAHPPFWGELEVPAGTEGH